MPSILFVCTGNQYRSPLATAIFLRLLDKDGRYKDWKVASAGTWTIPGMPLNPHTLETARSLGLDLSGQQTRLVDAGMLDESDLILVMEPGQKEALGIEFPGSRPRLSLLPELVDGLPASIPDPADPDVDLDETADELAGLLERGFQKIVQKAQSLHKARSKGSDS